MKECNAEQRILCAIYSFKCCECLTEEYKRKLSQYISRKAREQAPAIAKALATSADLKLE